VSDDRPGNGTLLLGLAKSAALIGAAAAANAGRRAAATIVGYLFVAALLAAGLCFLTLSAYRALADGLGEIFAALIVGCAYLFAALTLALALQLRRR
jgi:hypothetical protein